MDLEQVISGAYKDSDEGVFGESRGVPPTRNAVPVAVH